MTFCINNIDNYNSNLITEKKIINHYLELISEYINYSNEHIIIQNKNKHHFIIKRGLDTISKVFNFLLLYTKNIDLTMYHCKKSYYYYVEFIGQIGYDNNSYLQLNSKDATLFVYKKTIFEINNEYRKNFELSDRNKKKLKNVYMLIEITNELFSYMLINEYTSNIIIKKINKIIINLIQNKNNLEKLELFLCFIRISEQKKINIDLFIDICVKFVKYIYIKETNKKQIQKSVYCNIKTPELIIKNLFL